MQEKFLNQLQESDLGRKAGIDIGFDQIESGILTDFYGAMDSDTHAVIAVENDNNLTFFMSPNSKIQIY